MSDDIRLATTADLPSVETIVEAAYSPYVARIGRKPGPMLDDYAELIRQERVHVLEHDGGVKAILVLIPEDEAMLLDNVAVAPDARGLGLGRRLIEFAEDAARAAGFKAIRLYTHVMMTENVTLYGRAGYVETHRGEEKGFQRVYMTKAL
jgi:GNAT superfamily N-acetyltransferase